MRIAFGAGRPRRFGPTAITLLQLEQKISAATNLFCIRWIRRNACQRQENYCRIECLGRRSRKRPPTAVRRLSASNQTETLIALLDGLRIRGVFQREKNCGRIEDAIDGRATQPSFALFDAGSQVIRLGRSQNPKRHVRGQRGSVRDWRTDRIAAAHMPSAVFSLRFDHQISGANQNTTIFDMASFNRRCQSRRELDSRQMFVAKARVTFVVIPTIRFGQPLDRIGSCAGSYSIGPMAANKERSRRVAIVVTGKASVLVMPEWDLLTQERERFLLGRGAANGSATVQRGA